MTPDPIAKANAPKGGVMTYSGEWFFPLKPRLEGVLIEDIAHALSLICRFTGHIARFYSVAEHCIHVSDMVPKQQALQGLLHDASETYIADVSSPVKNSPEFKAYREIEDRLQAVIYERFGLPSGMPASVHRADQLIVKAEARVMFKVPPPWAGHTTALDDWIRGWSSKTAEIIYLKRFKELTERKRKP
jgi:hypothetical protein